MILDTIYCPLCKYPMAKDEGYYRCTNNPSHSCLINGEYDRYMSGEKELTWLYARMKVRLGKLIHQK